MAESIDSLISDNIFDIDEDVRPRLDWPLIPSLPPGRSLARNWVWVLSGGGARGAFQLGAGLYLMRDIRFQPRGIAACSVGSVNALAFAEGNEAGAEKLRDVWLTIQNRNDMYAWTPGWIDDIDAVLRPHGLSGKALLQSLVGTRTFQMPSNQRLLRLNEFLYDLHSDSFQAIVANVATLGMPALLLLEDIESGAEALARAIGHARSIIQNTKEGLFVFDPLREKMLRNLDGHRLWEKRIPIRFAVVRLGDGKVYHILANHQSVAEAFEVDEDYSGKLLVKKLGSIRPEVGLYPNELVDFALASSSIPVINTPTDLVIAFRDEDDALNFEHVAFVDGGVRDVLPVDAAVTMLDNELTDIRSNAGLISIICGSSYIDQKNILFPALNPYRPRGVHSKARFTMFETADLAFTYLSDEVLTNERRAAAKQVPDDLDRIIIAPSVPIGDSNNLDPGLIQIQLAYGWMTAYDQVRFRLNGDQREREALWRSTNTIIQARLLCWKLEQVGTPIQNWIEPRFGREYLNQMERDVDWSFFVANRQTLIVHEIRKLKRRIYDEIVARVQRFGLESLPDVHDLSNFASGNVNSFVDWWKRWERHAFDPDTDEPTGPGLHVNQSTATGWARLRAVAHFEKVPLGRTATSPWGPQPEHGHRSEGSSIRALEPFSDSAFERSPDYTVIRLEGFIADEHFDANGSRMMPLLHVWDSDTTDNSLRLENEIPPLSWYRTKDRIFSPRESQPAGTIPLYRWYSRSLQDSLATTEFRFTIGNPFDGAQPRPVILPDYANPQLVGYIFSPDAKQPANTKPLWRWFSPSRMDNDTTVHHSWVFDL